MARGRGTFGLSSSRGQGRENYRSGGFRGSFRGGRGRSRGGSRATGDAVPRREDDGTQLAERFEKVRLSDEIDEKMGFLKMEEGAQREGWLVNMHPVSTTRVTCNMFSHYGTAQTLLKDSEYASGIAAVDFYFIQDDGGMFKCTFRYEPYFYIACKVKFHDANTRTHLTR